MLIATKKQKIMVEERHHNMSKIEWTQETWNPIAGCTKCSPGCDNCYAERMAARLASMGKEGYCHVTTREGKWNGKIYHLFNNRPDKPLHWRKPRKIFVCSMSDLFHPKVPFEFQVKLFDMMNHASQHTYQLLTKRPENMRLAFRKYLEQLDLHFNRMHKVGKNVWLGVTVCTQAEADEKIPILLQIPAAKRFVSIEPMLENIILGPKLGLLYPYDEIAERINWVIVGGESGPKRRECKIEWVESIVDQCKVANVKLFVKQIHKDGKLVKMPAEFPQEYPNGRTEPQRNS